MSMLWLAIAAQVAVTPALLEGLPVSTVTLAAHGKEHACQGPPLIDVLARMGGPGRESLHGKVLSKGVIVRARDGYEVLFSLGELAPSLGNATAIIATQCDGAAIDAKDGPLRLVVASDRHPSRSVRQLKSLEIK